MIIGGFDTETTGLKQADGHRFVEVCLRLYDLDSRKLKWSYSQRINPMRSIATAAYNVHGISLSDLVGMPEWEAVAPELVKLIDGCGLIVAHNGKSFDLPFLTGELERIGLKMPNVPLFDTMLEGRWATATGKVPNLGELCFATDVDYDTSKAHSAIYDVDVMVKAFFKGIDLGAFKL